eukprot:4204686-Prymnesium_polylepis.1
MSLLIVGAWSMRVTAPSRHAVSARSKRRRSWMQKRTLGAEGRTTATADTCHMYMHMTCACA